MGNVYICTHGGGRWVEQYYCDTLNAVLTVRLLRMKLMVGAYGIHTAIYVLCRVVKSILSAGHVQSAHAKGWS